MIRSQRRPGFLRVLWNEQERVKILWELLVCDSLLPEDGLPKHLLWAFYFFKVYPKQGLVCMVIGASNGAVDPKTHF